ncbi:hypothetical protein PMIN04_005562 [Paraphaeosphaeria minitans]|uniref:Acyl-protein thioesterase 1 n=1 Tax=Paraphaeosphaeria minitans TaxID=565426 RepID=A0A9P6G8S8_9PLEO|nr:acyl-protein thioesterase 1 [Paraphaeosphaeria minitans]
MPWALANTLHNLTAWYALSLLPPSRPELEGEEDAEAIPPSAQYLASLIDDLVSQGIAEKRVVLGGFSQGYAMALFTNHGLDN